METVAALVFMLAYALVGILCLERGVRAGLHPQDNGEALFVVGAWPLVMFMLWSSKDCD